MKEFYQQSGRTGRDGNRAESIVLLGAAWKPQEGGRQDDVESMQLYLTQKHCARGVMSQFLDERPDWRWCMEGDELCGVCPALHTERRPGDQEFSLPRQPEESKPQQEGEGGTAGEDEIQFTGPGEVLRQDRVQDEVLSRYEKDPETMASCCLYYRTQGRKFEHEPTSCPRRHHWTRAKTSAFQTRKKQGYGGLRTILSAGSATSRRRSAG